MAIIPSRLSVDTITKLNQIDFESKKDEISVTSPSKTQVGPTVEAAAAMVNNEQPKHGVVDTPGNSTYDGSKSIPKTKKLKTSQNNVAKTDELTFSLNDILNTETPIDSAFTLTASSEKKLDDIIAVNVKSAKKDYPSLDTVSLTNDVKTNVTKSLNSIVGNTIKSKKNLIGTLKDCFSLNDLDLSLNLDYLINLSILNSLDCSGIDKFISGLGDLGKGIGTLAASMISPNSDKTVDKLLYSKILKDALPDDISLVKANTSTKGTISRVLDNLADSNYKTNSNASLTKDLYASLDSYDPEWKKDDLGEVNYFKVKDNDFMIGNAVSYNENKFTMPTVATNEVNTNIDESMAIAIISA